MNEFIVWHKLRKEFVHPYRNIVFDNDGICENDLCDICNYIGLTDIDCKKIYADCSIVEFYFGNNLEEERLLTGYFSFNNENLRYQIKDINTKEAIYLWTGYIESGLTVIDTIQENKLGLIK